MVGASTSSSTSSCAFFGSFVEGVGPSAASKPSAASSASSVSRLKFVCSYGGRILPRYTDGKLRYFGGDTRIFAVDRSAAFSELQEKMRDFCGWTAVGVRCQLPTEDLDALVSIKSDEDLFNLVELYDLAGRQKIRAFLFPLASKPSSPPPAATSGDDRSTPVTSDRYVQIPRPAKFVGRYAGYLGDAHRHDHYHHHHHHHQNHGHNVAPWPCNYHHHHRQHHHLVNPGSHCK
ncbi:uncharacterized protein LOC122048599 [Zingiber officinale]|nr:uncharacterized protein LOC122048599 [Zingiber officinale]